MGVMTVGVRACGTDHAAGTGPRLRKGCCLATVRHEAPGTGGMCGAGIFLGFGGPPSAERAVWDSLFETGIPIILSSLFLKGDSLARAAKLFLKSWLACRSQVTFIINQVVSIILQSVQFSALVVITSVAVSGWELDPEWDGDDGSSPRSPSPRCLRGAHFSGRHACAAEWFLRLYIQVAKMGVADYSRALCSKRQEDGCGCCLEAGMGWVESHPLDFSHLCCLLTARGGVSHNLYLQHDSRSVTSRDSTTGPRQATTSRSGRRSRLPTIGGLGRGHRVTSIVCRIHPNRDWGSHGGAHGAVTVLDPPVGRVSVRTFTSWRDRACRLNQREPFRIVA